MERRHTSVLNYTFKKGLLVLALSYITMFCPCSAESMFKTENGAVGRLNFVHKLPPWLINPYQKPKVKQILPHFQHQGQPLHPVYPLEEQFYGYEQHNRFRRSKEKANLTTTAKKHKASSLNKADSSDNPQKKPKGRKRGKATSKSRSNSDVASKAYNSEDSEPDHNKKTLPIHEKPHKKFAANNRRKKVIKRKKKPKAKKAATKDDNSEVETAESTSEITESIDDTEPSTNEGVIGRSLGPQLDKAEILDNASDSQLKNSEESEGGDDLNMPQDNSETTPSSATGRSLEHNNPTFGPQDADGNAGAAGGLILPPEKDLSVVLDSAFDKFWKHSETEQKKETFSMGSLPPGIPANFFGDADETLENK